MSQFMLLLHENPAAVQAMSPEEMQRTIEKYAAWSQRLAEEGRLVRGEKLRDEGGRHVRPDGRAGAASVTDGPYVEGKEVVGGFFVVEAPDYDGAVGIARDCPHLGHGWIEVREVEPL